ncbi:MAG: cold shock domain-containing protein [Lachnospiraceae bacterium]|nr:cold shock domain-containing protein [Lachnospiraceae bacterium]MBD5395636.1 cold shock domain-containing protein [Lachnospiraceae bacterium]
MIGQVKFFDHKKRYGFITGDDGMEYYFSSANVDIPSGILDRGYTVFFTPSLNDRGRVALNIKLY